MLLAVVVPAFASCKLRCNTAARGRSFDRSQKRRYNWGHNTFAGEAHLGIHDELLVPALPPQYAMDDRTDDRASGADDVALLLYPAKTQKTPLADD